ncbi:hypothetical protein Tco_0946746 [Tanacetum coccineum]
MSILAIMSNEIKELQVYADYITKYPQAQTTPKHGMGKGLMRKGDVPKLKKKKDVVPRCKRSITINDNVLSDLDEALKIKRKDTGEGSGATPESLNHSNSSDESSEYATYATDDTNKSEKELDQDESENDFENGDESDKSNSDEESGEIDKSDIDSKNGDDHNEDFVME